MCRVPTTGGFVGSQYSPTLTGSPHDLLLFVVKHSMTVCTQNDATLQRFLLSRAEPTITHKVGDALVVIAFDDVMKVYRCWVGEAALDAR